MAEIIGIVAQLSIVHFREEDTDLLDLIGDENVFPAEARFGASIEQALQRAEAWKNQQS